jgi:Fe2+ or Zn2+ uptake regulation protein
MTCPHCGANESEMKVPAAVLDSLDDLARQVNETAPAGPIDVTEITHAEQHLLCMRCGRVFTQPFAPLAD